MPGKVSEASKCEAYFDALDTLPKHKNNEKEEVTQRNGRLQRQLSINGFFSDHMSINGGRVGGEQMSVYAGQVGAKRKDSRGLRRLANGSEAGRSQSLPRRDERSCETSGKRAPGNEEDQHLENHNKVPVRPVRTREPSVRFRGSGPLRRSSNQHATDQFLDDCRISIEQTEEDDRRDSIEPREEGDPKGSSDPGEGNCTDSLESSSKSMADTKVGSPEDSDRRSEIVADSSANRVDNFRAPSPVKGASELEEATFCEVEGAGVSLPVATLDPTLETTSDGLTNCLNGSAPEPPVSQTVARSLDAGDIDMLLQPGSGGGGLQARNRWRRVKHTLAFAHHMSQNIRSGSSDLLEHGEQEQGTPNYSGRGDAGRAGAAAFEGARLRGRSRAKGRQGMEGMLVRQDKGIITLVQDFYVACLKMPIAHFLVGVFLAPIALGLLFTPIYLLDKGGLAFDGVTLAEEIVIVGRVAAAKQKVSALVNVFLYALSLSTTFGGSPVAALSPFCLCIANVNTLMGQFLFVFLSGAVFARMSQPSHPIRCSKKAIIRADDFTSLPSDDPKERPKVFAVRLVLTGPPPCELVDAKICLTFRIFIKLPSGSMFCSTQDLDLVRPEVSYLRYGIMVRHVIDQKSPVYGHTMESLLDGDASFSLTVMGLERTSMQPIFHLEDYFVCDGDVAWDADYVDFIHINSRGHRVLDHSKIDLIRVTKDTRIGRSFEDDEEASEMRRRQQRTSEKEEQATLNILKGVTATGIGRRKAPVNSKSTSFTRADW